MKSVEEVKLLERAKTTESIMERLQRFPVTNAIIDYPKDGGNVQVEPEVALYADIVYSAEEDENTGRLKVERLVPRQIVSSNQLTVCGTNNQFMSIITALR